ncbi:hypothetical protein GCM10011391_29870 [Pullulanibacillus camelliae]|uniref:Dihydrodipicolinate synthase family protein n=1 Tax=Pullulanibacillus camelliae TaxID=1707096 RepID=A0A8J2YKR6_9BACL|nr:dihydrodipicolinate synthase family protein [Pullulanibacillus camelliae]GGE49081.1 hypothetical protein GCM10011391_29870 [Pullulanibacillus camelliae]
MSSSIVLPHPNGERIHYTPTKKSLPAPLQQPAHVRSAYAAAHVVTDPLADIDIINEARLDWEATLAYRHYLWSLGFSVAEAMDTAQRGMGLNWLATQELIRRSVAEAKAVNGEIACGAGTDQLDLATPLTIQDVIAAYLEQCAFIESVGGQIILMASQALVKVAQHPEDYAKVYNTILSQVSEPVILHWLGDMFDPKLTGYWGSPDVEEAMTLCLQIIQENHSKIKGIKLSLLDANLEVRMRRALPADVSMYTGDDFNYPDLILGDEHGYSHALLGIFDAIAPLASAALKSLDEENVQQYKEILAPTVPLSRHIFKTPTRFYKTGVVFLAYLNGHQDHFKMVGGLESMRSLPHLSKLFVLADQAGLFSDPDRAIDRMNKILDISGVI